MDGAGSRQAKSRSGGMGISYIYVYIRARITIVQTHLGPGDSRSAQALRNLDAFFFLLILIFVPFVPREMRRDKASQVRRAAAASKQERKQASNAIRTGANSICIKEALTILWPFPPGSAQTTKKTRVARNRPEKGKAHAQ